MTPPGIDPETVRLVAKCTAILQAIFIPESPKYLALALKIWRDPFTLSVSSNTKWANTFKRNSAEGV